MKLRSFRAGLLFVAAVLLISVWYIAQRNSGANRTTLETRASEIVARCESDEIRSRCYDREIPKLLGALTMNEVFRVTKLVQERDQSYWFCHLLAHSVGAGAYDRAPAKWRETVSECPVGMCSNGCVHGVIQKHFGRASLENEELGEVLPALKTVCATRPTPQQEMSCIHEIGHLSLYLMDGDVERAAKACDSAVQDRQSPETFARNCYEGILMQIFQPLDPDDFGLVYGKIPKKELIRDCESLAGGEEKSICWRKGWRGEVAPFCDQFSGEIRNACFSEAWVIPGKEIETPEGITAVCAYTASKEERRKCSTKVFYGLLSRFRFNETRMEEICAELPGDMQSHCVASTASRLFETDASLSDRALGVCSRASANGFGEECYRGLAVYAGFVLPKYDPALRKFCMSIPAPWNENCGK